MGNFDTALKFVLRNEGGYVNHDLDRGGATNYGITHKTLRKYRNKPVTIDDIKNLTMDEVKDIYRTMYWDTLYLDSVDVKLSTLVFDQAVNRGPKSACKQLQRILKVKADGSIGKISHTALTNYLDSYGSVLKLGMEYIKESQTFYVTLVKRRPNQIAFLHGWMNRTHEMMDVLI